MAKIVIEIDTDYGVKIEEIRTTLRDNLGLCDCKVRPLKLMNESEIHAVIFNLVHSGAVRHFNSDSVADEIEISNRLAHALFGHLLSQDKKEAEFPKLPGEMLLIFTNTKEETNQRYINALLAHAAFLEKKVREMGER